MTLAPRIDTIEANLAAISSGELNGVTNAIAATDTTNWTGVTRVASGSPLAPTISTAFNISLAAGAESSVSGGYTTVNMPVGLQNKKLKIEFYFTTPVTDDYRVSVRKGGVRVPLTTDSGGFTSLPTNTTGKFVAYFDSDTTSGWTAHVTRFNGTAGPCVITNVIVGPGIQPQGAVVGEWVSYTPTVTNLGTGSSTNTGFYRRVGDSLEVAIRVVKDGSGGSGGAGVTVSLPTGLNVDATKMQTTTGGIRALTGIALSSTGAYVAGLGVGTPNTLRWLLASAGSEAGGPAFVANSIWDIKTTVPIAEWAGSGTVNLAQNDVEYVYNTSTSTSAADTTSFGYGPQGATIQSITAGLTRRVRFQTPIQSGSRIEVEVDTDNIGVWVPLPATQGSSGRQISPLIVLNNTQYGMGSIKYVNSTDVDIDFGQYRSSDAATLGGAGPAWSTVSGAKWRVRKSSGGSAVGFGKVTSVSSGLVPASGSLGIVRVGTQNGYGSTNTNIRKFSTVIENTSTDVTYSNSATLGDSFTIVTSGLYAMSYVDAGSGGCNMGISRNSSQLTTNIAAITQADRIAFMSPTAIDAFQTCSVTMYLAAGDVIRAHTDAIGATSSPARSSFTIQRIY